MPVNKFMWHFGQCSKLFDGYR